LFTADLCGEELTDDDLTDLLLLRLDSVTAINVDDKGFPVKMQTAVLMPPNLNLKNNFQIL